MYYNQVDASKKGDKDQQHFEVPFSEFSLMVFCKHVGLVISVSLNSVVLFAQFQFFTDVPGNVRELLDKVHCVFVF